MADIRINALATTAASTASDDYIAIDGSANGTRKLNAYSPTFGGNLTVSGTGIITATGPNDGTAFPFLSSATDLGGFATYSSGASADQKRWAWQHGSAIGDGTIRLRAINDALSSGINALTFTRSGISSVAATIGGNLTTTGNLTVSGTGTSSFGGTVRSGSGSGETLTAGSVDVGKDIGIASTQGIVQGAARIVTFTNGNVLLGTPTDSSNGKLQLATHTTSAGGIGFGTDSSLFSASATVLRFNGQNSDTQIQIAKNGTTGFGILVDGASTYITASGSSGVMYLRTNGGTTALTLDSSQNATFAGNVKANGGYFQGPSGANLGIVAASGRSLDLYSDGGILGLTIVSGTGNATFAGAVTLPNDKAIYFKEVGGTAQRFALNSGDVIYIEPDQLHKISIGGSGVTNVGVGGIGVAGNSVFGGSIAIGNTVQTAAAVASTHKVTISIGGSTYYLLATNV